VIDAGRVIAEGTADELTAHVGGDRLELTISQASNLAAAARGLSDHTCGPVRIDEGPGRLVAPVPRGALILSQVVRTLDEAQVVAVDLGLHRPSLDDVFLALTVTGRGGPPPVNRRSPTPS